MLRNMSVNHPAVKSAPPSRRGDPGETIQLPQSLCFTDEDSGGQPYLSNLSTRLVLISQCG